MEKKKLIIVAFLAVLLVTGCNDNRSIDDNTTMTAATKGDEYMLYSCKYGEKITFIPPAGTYTGWIKKT